MKPASTRLDSNTTCWNERVLIAALVATMVLSLLGYMHA